MLDDAMSLMKILEPRRSRASTASDPPASALEHLRRWVKWLLFHVVARRDPQRYIQLRCAAMRLLGTLGAYEHSHLTYLRRLVGPGALVVDVGAHFGIYTQALCSLVGAAGKVHAFEPQTRVFDALQRLRSSHDNLELHRVALSSSAGAQTLRIPLLMRGVPEPALATLEPVSCPHEADEIATRTLDSYQASLPGLAFVKVDVEGHEIDFLEGAREVLASCRPVVQIEDNTGGQRLAAYLREGRLPGYVLCILIDGELREFDAATGRDRVNFYLVPGEGGTGAGYHAGPRAAGVPAASRTR
jgi:FkbM family methyltransferase